MFGMGGSEILVILIVALLFLGPDKLPEAAKSISKGIRDIKKQSRVLQQTIEDDEHIGGAIRDLKSALRGEEAPRPRPARPKPQLPESTTPAGETTTTAEPGAPEHAAAEAPNGANGTHDADPPPNVILPPTAGEADPGVVDDTDPAELAALIKPAAGTVARSDAKVDDKVPAEPVAPESKHG